MLTRDGLVAWFDWHCSCRARRSLRGQQPHVSRTKGNAFPLSKNFWAEAALLAAGRLLSNHSRRHAQSARDDNEGIDLLGSAAELMLWQFVSRWHSSCASPLDDGARPPGPVVALGEIERGIEYMCSALYVDGGGRGADGADLSFGGPGSKDAIDAKSFDFAPNHKLFAINAKKHTTLAAQQPHYFCLLTPPFGEIGFVAFVPYGDVDTWEVRELVEGKPPARCQPMAAFSPTYLSLSFYALRQQPPPVYAPSQIAALAATGQASRASLANKAPAVVHAYMQARFEDALASILAGRSFV